MFRIFSDVPFPGQMRGSSVEFFDGTFKRAVTVYPALAVKARKSEGPTFNAGEKVSPITRVVSHESELVVSDVDKKLLSDARQEQPNAVLVRISE